MELKIPKMIYQTFPTHDLPQALKDNVGSLRVLNGSWGYKLFDDSEIIEFIASEYGKDMLAVYESISNVYGAARADLFRYLLMYKMGGVYLDIKSNIIYPLDKVIDLDGGYILSNWRNDPSGKIFGSGKHPELSAYPQGELQQWFIICKPSHPYLAAVIEKVLENIRSYRPWKYGVGRTGVLRTTGPIAYTLAIEPIRKQHNHLFIEFNENIGLKYNSTSNLDHRKLFNKHYTQQETAIIKTTGVVGMLSTVYLLLRKIKRALFNAKESL